MVFCMKFLIFFLVFHSFCFASIDFETFNPEVLKSEDIQRIKQKAQEGDKDYQYALSLVYQFRHQNLFNEVVYNTQSHNPETIAAKTIEMKKEKEQQIYWLKKAAYQDHVFALVHLANYYKAEKNFNEMLALLKRAVEQNSIPSAVLIYNHHLQQKNYEEYIEWLIKASKLGDDISQTKLIDIYLGKSLELKYLDYKKAVYWIDQFANQYQNIYAQYQFAIIYFNSLSSKEDLNLVTKDYSKAVYWSEKVIFSLEGLLSQLSFEKLKRGTASNVNMFMEIKTENLYREMLEETKSIHQTSLYQLAQNHVKLKQTKEAFKMFYLSGRQGYVPSLYEVALMYLRGEAVSQNYKEAAYYFYKILETRVQNQDEIISKSSYQLYLMHQKGQGMLKNFEEALKFLTLSANKGYAQAQFELGSMYYYGKGVKKDYKKAQHWFQILKNNKALDFFPEAKAFLKQVN